MEDAPGGKQPDAPGRGIARRNPGCSWEYPTEPKSRPVRGSPPHRCVLLPPEPDRPGDSMNPIYIDDPRSAEGVRRALSDAPWIALDCEAAGYHRYSDRLCLVQLTTPEGTWIIDPLAFPAAEVLRDAVEDPGTPLFMHGSDYDMRLLDRDLGIRPRGLFDTQIAASLLGEPALGLSALLERHFGIQLSKKFQRADWAIRPLSGEMLAYAAGDTQHLAPLTSLLRDRLEETGRIRWAEEEFLRLEEIRHTPEEEGRDPVLRVKRGWEIELRTLNRLRAALEWRDAIARTRDRAPFRIAGDPALLAAAMAPPSRVEELARIEGFPPALAQSPAGAELLSRFAEVDALPVSELRPYPARDRRGAARPLPEVEQLAERLKEARNRIAEGLGLDRGVLLANGIILEIARLHPVDAEGIRSIEGIRRWQAELLEESFVPILRKTPRPN